MEHRPNAIACRKSFLRQIPCAVPGPGDDNTNHSPRAGISPAADKEGPTTY